MENNEFNETKNMTDDFKDINQKNKYKDYIIVGILYLIVIVLIILFVIGIKHQKDTILDNSDMNESINDTVEDEIVPLPEDTIDTDILDKEDLLEKDENLIEDNIDESLSDDNTDFIEDNTEEVLPEEENNLNSSDNSIYDYLGQ